MTTFIIGGSNSLISGGWTQDYKANSDKNVINLSIGGTTSLMGLYRILSEKTIKANDTVIWEYALNEVNHAKFPNFNAKMLLKNTEHLIILCRDIGCKFSALILTPLVQERKKERHKYFSGLFDLLENYDVPYLDASRECRKTLSLDKLTKEFYKNSAHYLPKSPIIHVISSFAQSLSSQARIPAKINPLYTNGKRIELQSGFCDDYFENNLIKIRTKEAPIQLNFEQKGKVIGLYIVAEGGKKSSIRVKFTGHNEEVKRFQFSTRNKSPKRLLKCLHLEAVRHGSWHVCPGDVLDVRVASRSGTYFTQKEGNVEISHPDANAKHLICGCLLEID